MELDKLCGIYILCGLLSAWLCYISRKEMGGDKATKFLTWLTVSLIPFCGVLVTWFAVHLIVR